MNKEAFLMEKENVSSNRASEGKGKDMRETLESYRRTKNMLKDLTKNLKPKATTQRLSHDHSRDNGFKANESLTRKIQRNIA
jgi:hypothetical protein